METKLTPSQHSEMVLADHELIEQYVENINKMFSSGSARATKEAIEELKRFLSSTIVAHFAYEENEIFPVLLQTNSSEKIGRFVSELREEHESLRKEAKRLTEMFSNSELTAHSLASLRVALIHFFHNLRKHSSKENKVFPSLL